MDRTTLDRFGRILVPKPLRKRLGIKPGDALSLDVEKGRLVAKPVRPEGEWIVRDGLPMWTGPVPEETQDIVAFLKRQRDEDDRKRFGFGIPFGEDSWGDA